MAGIVLITGGAGFIGSHLAEGLIAEGRRVRILDSFDPQVHSGTNNENTGLETLKGDVTQPSVWATALDGVTEVVHFAAAVGVGQSMYEIAHYCRTNVLGTAYMLEAVARQKASIAKLLVASSMSIYGEGFFWCDYCKCEGPGERAANALKSGQWEPMCATCGRQLTAGPTPETKPLRPASVYAINKRDQEDMCLVVGRAYGVPAVALRFFNVYGPGQSLSNPYTGVAAVFAASLLAGSPPLIFEDGRQTRDFVHVRDVARACIRALTDPGVSDVALNVGTGRATSITQLASILHRELGGPAPQVVGRYRAGDVRHCFADISATRQHLGWEPSVSLEQGMEELLKWFRAQPIGGSRLKQAFTELRAHGLVT